MTSEAAQCGGLRGREFSCLRSDLALWGHSLSGHELTHEQTKGTVVSQ